jgi:hypothetical protein
LADHFAHVFQPYDSEIPDVEEREIHPQEAPAAVRSGGICVCGRYFSVKNILTTLEHPHTLVMSLQLIFTRSLDLYQHLRDSAFVMEELKRISQHGFQEYKVVQI